MVDYPTLVGNNIVTNESNFGNVEELLAVVNLKLILGELSVPDNLRHNCAV